MSINNNILNKFMSNNSLDIQKNAEIQLPPKVKYHYQEPFIVEKLSYCLYKKLMNLNPTFNKPIAIVGIGTDRSTGDCLGPLVGTHLLDFHKNLFIYGTLDDPVHATNLVEKIESIKKDLNSPIIIAIDASLGRSESIGNISLDQEPIKPGAGVNKKLPDIGDISFTGIVNIGGYMEYFVLQNTRLNIVWNMANLIAKSIKKGYKLFEEEFRTKFKENINYSSH